MFVNQKDAGQPRKVAKLPALDDDQRDDAEFRGKDRAWSVLLREFIFRREKEGLTFEELGRRIGRSKSQVHRWFQDPMKMSMTAFGLLAEALDCELVIDVERRLYVRPNANDIHPSDAAAKFIELSINGYGAAKTHQVIITNASSKQFDWVSS